MLVKNQDVMESPNYLDEPGRSANAGFRKGLILPRSQALLRQSTPNLRGGLQSMLRVLWIEPRKDGED